MLIRFFDIVISFFALIVLSPVLLVLWIVILCIDGSPALFDQKRSGKDFKAFSIYKFRTMLQNSEDEKGVTAGSDDFRITALGKKLRKYKLDELPQFFNVLSGTMSVVGSRPQVPYYAEKFESFYKQILILKPGILSPSAIEYSNEEDILSATSDPVAYYESVLIPVKCAMDIEMVRKFGLTLYFNTIISFLVRNIFGQTSPKK